MLPRCLVNVDLDEQTSRDLVSEVARRLQVPLFRLWELPELLLALNPHPLLVIVNCNNETEPAAIAAVRRLKPAFGCPTIAICRPLRPAGQASLLEAGADFVLASGADVGQLLEQLVRPLLAQSTPLQVGGLTIDLARHEAWFKDARATLTPSELSVLTLLASNADMVVPAALLTNGALGYPVSPAEATKIARVHIARLRSKLKELGLGLEIKTVRGRGYLLGEVPVPSSEVSPVAK